MLISMQLYGIPDQVWMEAAARSVSVKAAVMSLGAARYPAWFHMVKKYRPDLYARMREVAGTEMPTVLCSAQCGRPRRSQRRPSANGLCVNCYARQRNGSAVGPAGDRPDLSGLNCTHPGGCDRPQYAKELCNLHWQRLRSTGSVGGVDPMRENWWLKGFSAEEMRACKEFVYGKRSDRPASDEGIRLRIDYEAILRNDPCVYCGGEAGEVEHIVPLSRGGSAEWDNLAGACRSCNAGKHATSLLRFLLARNGG